MGIGLLGIAGWFWSQTPTGRHVIVHAEGIVGRHTGFGGDLQRAARATDQALLDSRGVKRVRVAVPHVAPDTLNAAVEDRYRIAFVGSWTPYATKDTSLAPVLTLRSDGYSAMGFTSGETNVRVVMAGKWHVRKARPAQLCLEPAANRGSISCLYAVKHGDLLVFGGDDPWKRTDQVAWNTALGFCHGTEIDIPDAVPVCERNEGK